MVKGQALHHITEAEKKQKAVTHRFKAFRVTLGSVWVLQHSFLKTAKRIRLQSPGNVLHLRQKFFGTLVKRSLLCCESSLYRMPHHLKPSVCCHLKTRAVEIVCDGLPRKSSPSCQFLLGSAKRCFLRDTCRGQHSAVPQMPNSLSCSNSRKKGFLLFAYLCTPTFLDSH